MSTTDPSGTTTTGETGETGEGQDDRCSLAPEVGDCDGAFVRWFFDEASQSCQTFTWGGCEGVVPFQTLGDCLGTCGSCEEALAEPPEAEIPVTIRNDYDVPIYLDRAEELPGYGLGYYGRREYQLFDALGEALELPDSLCGTAFACDSFASTCGGCDPGPPQQPGAIKIGPGVTYAAKTWDGNVLAQSEIRIECIPDACPPSGGATEFYCEFRSPYEGSEVFATAMAGTDFEGDDCDLGAEGWCATPAGTIPIAPVMASASGPAQPASLELVFGP